MAHEAANKMGAKVKKSLIINFLKFVNISVARNGLFQYYIIIIKTSRNKVF